MASNPSSKTSFPALGKASLRNLAPTKKTMKNQTYQKIRVNEFSKNFFAQLKGVVGGRIFSVRFVKKDGTERTMAVRFNVRSYVKGTQKLSTAQKLASHPTLIHAVYLMTGEKLEFSGWRSFHGNRVLSVRADGMEFHL